MARSNPLQSSVFRVATIATAVMAAVAAALIYFIATTTNTTLTRATEDVLQADVTGLQNEYRAGGLSALATAINEKLRWDSTGLYLLLDAQGARRAGNLLSWPENLQGKANAGVFNYRVDPGRITSPKTAAGVLISLDDGARLVVARDIENQKSLLAQLRSTLIIGIGTLAVLGLVGGYAFARIVLRRIDKIRIASESIMAGNLSGRIPVTGSGDELDLLAAQLNEMFDRIEQLIRGLREVSDNIAHDLKTPLNRLRNTAESALSDTRGSASWQEGLERTIEQADDLIKTFNALLLIARLEAGAVEESFELLDLAELCRGVAELYEPSAEAQGLAIQLVAEHSVHVLANRQLIGQAMANLIDNAIKYGAESKLLHTAEPAIAITVSTNGDYAQVHVADRGPGISESDRARSVKRFVRLDQSRSKPGTGLGLSLVAAVAQLHRGTIRLEDNTPGLRVVLSLPLASRDQTMAQSTASISSIATAS